MKLVTVLDTYFKPSAADSKDIDPKEMAFIPARSQFAVRAYRQEAGHIVFTIHPEDMDLKTLHPSGRNTWWCFEGAVEDPEGFGPNNKPQDMPAAPVKDKGIQIQLPGFTGTYSSDRPVASDTPNILWGEALHAAGGYYRKPESAAIASNIIKTAKEAQKIRNMYGKTLRVHSFFRDQATNRRVGGARYSMHTQGLAIDFSIPGVPVMEIYHKLNQNWPGGLAYSTKMGFVHVDLRHRIGGGKARWAYPGG